MRATPVAPATSQYMIGHNYTQIVEVGGGPPAPGKALSARSAGGGACTGGCGDPAQGGLDVGALQRATGVGDDQGSLEAMLVPPAQAS